MDIVIEKTVGLVFTEIWPPCCSIIFLQLANPKPAPHVSMPQKTVKNNDEIIDMGIGKNENNPYYCDAMDELYVDIDDQDIALFKNGKTTFLPGEFDWSKPELFISFPIIDDVLGGVGEFSMTRDGKQ